MLNNIRVRHQRSQPSQTCACREELNVQFRLSAAVHEHSQAGILKREMNNPSKGQGALCPQLQAGGEGPTGWGRASSDVQSGTGRPLCSSSTTAPCLGYRRASPCSRTFIPARQRALQAPPEAPCPKSAGGPQGLGRGAPSRVLAWVMALQPTGTPPFVSLVAGSYLDREPEGYQGQRGQ